MAFESFDNINQHELQAVIEAEMNLFENTRSTNTYTNMRSRLRFRIKRKTVYLKNFFTGRPRKKYPGRIELFYFFRALRPGYYEQQGIFFNLFWVHFHTTKTGT